MSAGKEKHIILKAKRNLVVLLAAVLALSAFAGCGRKEDAAAPTTVEQEIQNNAEDGADENVIEPQDEDKTPVTENVSSGYADVYIGADSVFDVTMGTFTDSAQTPLCKVSMPDSYYMASLYTDEAGQSQTMLETNGKLVSEIAESGVLETCPYVPTTVVITAQGNADDSYTFTIVDTGTISVASEKEYAPGGIEIAPGSEHEAYVYSTSGQFDVVMAYRINEDWTLLIENSGGLKNRMTLSEIGKAFYGLVTPVL